MKTRLLTKKDVAELMSVTVRTIERLVENRKIPFTRIPCASGASKRIRFSEDAIGDWLEKDSEAVREHEEISCQHNG